MKKNALLFLLFLLVTFVSQSLGQFYKVYGWKTRAKNEAELVLWNSFVVDSDLSFSFFDKDVQRQGLLDHSLELEYGITDRFTAAIYFDFEDPESESMKYFRTRAVFLR